MDWSDRIGRRIRLRDLHIVLAVAESGSMTKASAKLAISHPAVSKTISDLENTLGVRLFDRNAQGVELTAHGRALLKCGINVFDEMRQGLKQIEFLTDPTSGELAVGCPEIIIAGILPAIAEQFLQQYPAVKLRVIHADTALMQLDQLRERNVELLIGRMPQPFMEDDLASEQLFDEPFVTVAGMHSRWARRRHIELAELAEEPWVLPPFESAPGLLITEIFQTAGLTPPVPSVVTLSVQLTTTLVRESRRNSPKFRCAVQRKTCGTEDTPGETARFTGFGQYHHRQAPDYRPAGRTVHRLGSRGRKINIGANDAAESWLVTRTLPIGIFETCPTRAENVRKCEGLRMPAR
jgi:DNA-binding transcriptional LysR family regulator